MGATPHALTLYSAQGANCCERVRWALAHKGLPHELVDIDDPAQAGRWQALSPFGRVPILVCNGRALSESMAMLELLEDLQPQPALLPTDPWLRARVREASEAVNASIHPVQNSSVVRRFQPRWDTPTQRAFRAQWVGDQLQALAPKLWRDSPYAVGTQFTLADILVAVMAHKGRRLGMAPLPAYTQHWQHLMAQPAVRASCPLADDAV